ncbi:MAG: energy-coupling factor transporter transmembrane component T [Clostridia bacterium]|nr:energy-coupling factor transporter transmembrane protein EcfT [Clostridia bacterium]MDH7572122.1 energy-coupling factor transporter transmembrane component T [Clostridia bacterium]
MFERLFYEPKDVLLQRLHTATLLAYCGSLAGLALVFSHPLYLLAVLAAGALGVTAAQAVAKWRFYLRLGLWTAGLMLLINAAASPGGATVILRAGPARVSLEALVYGAIVGMRLLGVLTAFCVASTTLHPDRLLGIFSRWAYRSSLVLSLATRSLPNVACELVRAREALQVRGVNLEGGSLRSRLDKAGWLLDVLLVSCLEGALETAEALQARGLGCGPRSHFRREVLRPRDASVLAGVGLSLTLSSYALLTGAAGYACYPRLAPLDHNDFWLPMAVLAGLSLPAILSWGWQYWPYLRSKI